MGQRSNSGRCSRILSAMLFNTALKTVLSKSPSPVRKMTYSFPCIMTVNPFRPARSRLFSSPSRAGSMAMQRQAVLRIWPGPVHHKENCACPPRGDQRGIHRRNGHHLRRAAAPASAALNVQAFDLCRAGTSEPTLSSGQLRMLSSMQGAHEPTACGVGRPNAAVPQ